MGKFWYMKGVANMERGFSEDAVDALKKSNTLVPGDKQVCQLLQKAHQDKRADTVTANGVWKEALLTENEKQCMRPWWDFSSLPGKCKQRCKRQRNTSDATNGTKDKQT